MRKKVGIIGHFAFGQECFDGQTVKTKTLHDELVRAGVDDIVTVDTALNASNKPRLLTEAISCAFRCENVILLVSRGGLAVFLPLLSFLKKIGGAKLYLDVIGGNMASLIETNPSWLSYIASFDGVWAETKGAAADLAVLGLGNVRVIPNFKRLDIREREYARGSDKRYCIFSRVMREKGITEAVHAVASARRVLNSDAIFLDVWGPIDEGYRDEFELLLQENRDFLSYRGIANYGESGEALAGCYALLFPSRWEGEGFPGTIVDAFAAGLPVLASNWNANAEIVENGETGLVYPCEEAPDLASGIMWLAQHEAETLAMSMHCNDEAKKYLPDLWIAEIKGILE